MKIIKLYYPDEPQSGGQEEDPKTTQKEEITNEELTTKIEELISSVKGLKEYVEKTGERVGNLENAYKDMFNSDKEKKDENKENEKIAKNVFDFLCE